MWLFEYDKRFELFAADKFVHYDLEEPLKFPEELRGTVDIAIADPPFLNEVRCISPILDFLSPLPLLSELTRAPTFAGHQPLLRRNPPLPPQTQRQTPPPHLDLRRSSTKGLRLGADRTAEGDDDGG